jgi:hypothetical protein
MPSLIYQARPKVSVVRLMTLVLASVFGQLVFKFGKPVFLAYLDDVALRVAPVTRPEATGLPLVFNGFDKATERSHS